MDIPNRLMEMLHKGAFLADLVMENSGDEPEAQSLAEEICAENAELEALLNEDWSSFSGPEVVDMELLALASWMTDGAVQLPEDWEVGQARGKVRTMKRVELDITKISENLYCAILNEFGTQFGRGVIFENWVVSAEMEEEENEFPTDESRSYGSHLNERV